MRDPLRAKLNVIVVAAVAFTFGLGLASALDFTPLSMAAGNQELRLTLGAPDGAQLDVSRGFSDIVERLSPAVVTIEVEQQVQAAPQRVPPPFEDFFREFEDQPQFREGSGSGFIVSPDGYIITNNHVVEGASRVRIQLHDQRIFENVEVVGRDPTTDVALLKVDAQGLTPAPLGYADSTRVGDWVLAIGSPGFGGATGRLPGTVTVGIVSAKGRSIQILGRRLQAQGMPNLAIEDFIQTDAAINPGNSGGPLVNARGEVIGVNTAIASTSGISQGYGFAVPIELVRLVVDDLVRFGEVRRAVIGVSIDEVSATDAEYYGLDRIAGVKVMDVGAVPGERESPAARAGIRPGDVIVAVDGRPVESVSDLQRRIRGYEPGDEIELMVVRRATRERERIRLTLAAAEQPDAGRRERTATEQRADPLGLEVQDLTAEVRRGLGLGGDVQGAVITNVTPRGPAARAGLGQGLVIVDLNGQAVESAADYGSAAAALEPGDLANMVVLNPQNGQHLVLTLRVPRP